MPNILNKSLAALCLASAVAMTAPPTRARQIPRWHRPTDPDPAREALLYRLYRRAASRAFARDRLQLMPEFFASSDSIALRSDAVGDSLVEAGVAAGVQGIAPEASIVALKVFGARDGCAGALASDVLAAGARRPSPYNPPAMSEPVPASPEGARRGTLSRVAAVVAAVARDGLAPLGPPTPDRVLAALAPFSEWGAALHLVKSLSPAREATALVAEAHALGLAVHAWTFRNEDAFLPANLRGRPRRELELAFAAGIDGVFTDFPDTAVAVRESLLGAAAPADAKPVR
mgnify:CR=1 FL=1